MSQRSLVAILLVLTFCAQPLFAQQVNSAEHWLEQGAVRLYVWEKVVGNAAGKPVVVLAHGSGTAGKESFDLQVPDKPTYSLMDFLAREGFDVFAADIRGFGRSTRPVEHMSTKEASDDLNAVIDFVSKLRGVEKINLLAWSWGTQYAGMVVMAHGEKVEKYISCAQMHSNSPDLARRKTQLENYRKNVYLDVSEAGWKKRFTSMTPPEVNDSDVVDAFARAASQVQTNVPTGPQLDMITLMPMLNPARMPVPIMIIHGEYDDVADLDGLLPFFHDLPNPNKKYVVIPQAGHMMHLQQGHRRLQHEVSSFFKAP